VVANVFAKDKLPLWENLSSEQRDEWREAAKKLGLLT
jgi:hypothetical protein